MANLKHKLHALALCAAALTFFGGPILAEKPKVAIVAINDTKADNELFALVRDTFSGSLKSAWGVKLVDNALAKLALKSVNNVDKIKAAGKLLSVDYVCIVGLARNQNDNSVLGGATIVANLFDVSTGEAIAEGGRMIGPKSPEKDAVRHSKALAKEMDKALKKKRLGEKAGALKDLVKK